MVRGDLGVKYRQKVLVQMIIKMQSEGPVITATQISIQ